MQTDTAPALPAYAEEELAALSPAALVELLIRDEDRVPRNVIDRCAAHGEDMVDGLRETVDGDRAWHDDASPGEWWLLLHTAMILGLIASESAGLLLVRLMRRLARAGDDDLQDWLAGRWPRLFANKPRSAVEAARALSEDRSLSWYIRCQASDIVIDAARRGADGALERELDGLAAQAADERDDLDFRLATGNTLLDFPRERHRPLLTDLAARQQEDFVTFSAAEIDAAFARDRDEPDWERVGNPWRFYSPGAIAARQDRWAEEAARGDDFIDPDDERFGEISLPYVRETEKVGRNDPCPCGSGKKNKKCCLPNEQA